MKDEILWVLRMDEFSGTRSDSTGGVWVDVGTVEEAKPYSETPHWKAITMTQKDLRKIIRK